jgi:DNA-binding transcriptional MocR family regulator
MFKRPVSFSVYLFSSFHSLSHYQRFRTFKTMSRGIKKKQINLLRGWPAPSLLPTSAIRAAAEKALSNPDVSTPGLLYGPDPGYQPLRESIQTWLEGFYEPSIPSHLKPSSHGGTGGNFAALGGEGSEPGDRICITGGASQNLACILQVFTDPGFTKVWMVAPAYFLAERIFEDSGLQVRGVGEGAEGIDLESLERYLEKDKGEERKVSWCT